MPLWNVAPVDDEPQTQLRSWAIFEVSRPDRTDPERLAVSRHFAGCAVSPLSSEGRASSAIQSFDPITRSGVTRSGRVYRLAGNPGLDSDAKYVWQRWMQINNVADFKDVTQEVLELCEQAKNGQGEDGPQTER